mmetsp:Transcript_43688/g.98776  ORF Transcript_43688/g.98776 Transcript_43688/m.98776 type:complete len:253 (-) Transcript_43688:1121-1879(-)
MDQPHSQQRTRPAKKEVATTISMKRFRRSESAARKGRKRWRSRKGCAPRRHDFGRPSSMRIGTRRRNPSTSSRHECGPKSDWSKDAKSPSTFWPKTSFCSTRSRGKRSLARASPRTRVPSRLSCVSRPLFSRASRKASWPSSSATSELTRSSRERPAQTCTFGRPSRWCACRRWRPRPPSAGTPACTRRSWTTSPSHLRTSPQPNSRKPGPTSRANSMETTAPLTWSFGRVCSSSCRCSKPALRFASSTTRC